ncbi:signal peptidase II [Streptococcus chenjunshii]|uniref:Signal peptidase II n=1 Tax=Streptococcus chenjunshii TaxID=2173853 RepID=A0A372KM86_9STRE|nr:stage 0 sporulation family protein [Streptococcus chenjunshii]AXQ79162.1 signal peptidase II [Streptococcus chenjunshii]RFU50995.1 signal peptidase II [Streptococcus chenjunshii]RFU53389.1 signal peptidase II [Streptococcus chenjunshii]
MTKVIGIKYGEKDDLTYVQSDKFYPKGDFLVVKNKNGSRLAKVVQTQTEMRPDKLPADLDHVWRRAGQKDFQANRDNRQLAERSQAKVRELIAEHRLQMKLLDIVFPLEKSYVLITFSAEERVDFRQLLKDLAAHFKTRVELRQINSRQEAKIYGGLGPCGRTLCCSTFLGEFPPVSIKMAKNQGLSLSSGKLTGLCGRLLCCLSFEDDFYQTSKKRFPDVGTVVETQNGVGVVAGINVFAETLQIRLTEQKALLTYAVEEVKIGG